MDDMMKKYVIGIDIGGTNFRMGMISEDGTLCNFVKRSSSILSTGQAIITLAEQISAYIDQFDAKENVEAVAIGIPSIVSKDKKVLYSTPNLEGFDNINIPDPLSALLGVPVFIDRDVNFLLQYDIGHYNLDNRKTILGFYIGTGLGNAIYIDGKFYSGKNGVAGELGHIPMYGLSQQCTCGNFGCSEVLCSGRHLEELAKEHFPDTDISNVFTEHGSSEIMTRFVTDLAIPIATEINILDPDYIVIGGGVISMREFPKDMLNQAIYQFSRKPYPAENLQIVFSEHTSKSGVFGSADYARKKLSVI
jgi:allose kinase